MATIPTPSPVAPEASETQAPIHHIGRMFGALFNPKPTFEDIARRPSWLAPVILVTGIALVSTVIFTQRVGWERFTQQQIERNPRAAERLAQVPPDQRQQAIARSAQIYKWVGYGSGVVAYLVIVVVVGLILMGSINLMTGASVDYKTSLGIVAHAYMPSVIAGVLSILILLLKDPETVDIEHLLASNVGAFLSSETPRWLVSLATAIDLFSFWQIFLLAIGFVATSPKKVALGKALATVIVVWGIYVLTKAGLVAAFS